MSLIVQATGIDELRQAISPELLCFLDELRKSGRKLHIMTPREVADEFRARFDVPNPMYQPDAATLLNKLGYWDVSLQPYLEHTYDIRGSWNIWGEMMKVLVDSNRPEASRIKSLLHEVIEPVWRLSQLEAKNEISQKSEELFANQFAAYVKLPADAFRASVERNGFDLRLLSDEFNETLACVTRQIRDVVMGKRLFYFCRFDLATLPPSAPANMTTAMVDSNGFCIRIEDVVKTFHSKPIVYEMPAVVAPRQREYRIVNPALMRYVDERRAVYLPSFDASAAFGMSAGADLSFDYPEMKASALLWHYGNKRRSGFFILLTGFDGVPFLEPVAGRALVERRPDIEWLFSYEYHIVKREKAAANPAVNWSDGEPVLVDSNGQPLYDQRTKVAWPGVHKPSDASGPPPMPAAA